MTTLQKLMDVKTLVAGIFPVVLGSVYSLYRFEAFNPMQMVVLGVAIVLLQCCANIINSIHDRRRRAVADPEPSEEALLTEPIDEIGESELLGYLYVFLFVDTVVALYYAATTHPFVIAAGGIGALIMYFYSAGNRPISHTPYGEFVAGATMGLGAMTTVIYIESGVLDLETVLVALPTAIYIGTMLLTDNISDHHLHLMEGRRTLPIHIGIDWAELLWIASCHSLLTLTAVFVFIGYWPMESFVLALILFPFRPIYRFRRIDKESDNKDKMMALIGNIGLRFHAAVVVGLIAGVIF